jgi:exosortase B
MASVPEVATGRNEPASPWLAWWPVALGLAALYLPTYWGLANGLWNTEEQGHGPLILAVTAYLIWGKRDSLVDTKAVPAPITGLIIGGVGLLAYVLGRPLDIWILEVGSQIPVLVGVLLFLRGWSAVRALWFPLLFLVFMVPLPGSIVDAITGPLKQQVSVIAEHLLYAAGYPIGRTGVILSVGPYQLLVADACSGLNSMYSLSALGLLYLYLMQYRSWWRNGIILASILPIAFVANVIRVMILILVTYHLGDEAGQGFLHGFAGMVLFVIALILLFALDAILGLFFRRSGNDQRRA